MFSILCHALQRAKKKLRLRCLMQEGKMRHVQTISFFEIKVHMEETSYSLATTKMGDENVYKRAIQ